MDLDITFGYLLASTTTREIKICILIKKYNKLSLADPIFFTSNIKDWKFKLYQTFNIHSIVLCNHITENQSNISSCLEWKCSFGSWSKQALLGEKSCFLGVGSLFVSHIITYYENE